MNRISPAVQVTDEYYDIQRLLRSISDELRDKQAQMTLAEFKAHLKRIGLDEVAAADFLASDGTVESMTDQLWLYFESPLKPRKLQPV